MINILFYLLFLLLNISISLEASDITKEPYLSINDDFNYLLLNKNREKVDDTSKKIDSMIAQGDTTDLVLMYKGVSWCFLSRNTFNVFKKKSYANECFKITDNINVEKYKNNNKKLYARLLLIRGLINARIPKFLDRYNIAFNDLHTLYSSTDALSLLSEQDKARLYSALSKMYILKDDPLSAEHFKAKALESDKLITENFFK